MCQNKNCDKPLTKYKEYYICEKCHEICPTENINSDETKNKIHNFLDLIKCEIIRRQHELHLLEQKYISNGPLSNEEDAIRTNLMKFNTIYNYFHSELFRSLVNTQTRKQLYDLLMISDWLINFISENKDNTNQQTG